MATNANDELEEFFLSLSNHETIADKISLLKTRPISDSVFIESLKSLIHWTIQAQDAATICSLSYRLWNFVSKHQHGIPLAVTAHLKAEAANGLSTALLSLKCPPSRDLVNATKFLLKVGQAFIDAVEQSPAITSDLISSAYQALDSADLCLLRLNSILQYNEHIDIVFPDRSLCTLTISTLKAKCRLQLGDINQASRILELAFQQLLSFDSNDNHLLFFVDFIHNEAVTSFDLRQDPIEAKTLLSLLFTFYDQINESGLNINISTCLNDSKARSFRLHTKILLSLNKVDEAFNASRQALEYEHEETIGFFYSLLVHVTVLMRSLPLEDEKEDALKLALRTIIKHHERFRHPELICIAFAELMENNLIEIAGTITGELLEFYIKSDELTTEEKEFLNMFVTSWITRLTSDYESTNSELDSQSLDKESHRNSSIAKFLIHNINFIIRELKIRVLLDSKTTNAIFSVLWNLGVVESNSHRFDVASQWFDACLSFLTFDDTDRESSIWRAKALCLLKSGNALAAYDASQKSLSLITNSDIQSKTLVGSLLIIFQCLIELNKTQEALITLNRLLTKNEFTEIEAAGLASECLDSHNYECALECLNALVQKLVLKYSDATTNTTNDIEETKICGVVHILHMIRMTLILSKKSTTISDEIFVKQLYHFTTAIEMIDAVRIKESPKTVIDQFIDIITWLKDFTYNEGLRIGSSDNSAIHSKEEQTKIQKLEICKSLLQSSIEFSRILRNLQNHNEQCTDYLEEERMCLMLIASASLYIIRDFMTDHSEEYSNELIQSSNIHIQCGVTAIEEALHLKNESDRKSNQHSSQFNDKSFPVLCLMEFELRARGFYLGQKYNTILLGIVNKEEHQSKILSLPTLEELETFVESIQYNEALKPRCWEIFSSLSFEFDAPSVGIFCLQRLLSQLLTQTQLDYSKIAEIYRELISLSASKQKSSEIFDEVCKLLTTQSTQSWPVVELEWLVSTAWNTGAFFYRLQNFVLSEQWMSRAFTILNSTPSFNHHRNKMQESYLCCTEKLRKKTEANKILINDFSG